MLISIASIGESSKRRVTSAYSSIVDPDTFAMKRVSEKSSFGRMCRTTWSTPGFCRPIAFSIPADVSQTRCGGLPRRGSSVVPFSTIAPTSRFENPSIRVYSSPKPTQPDSSTIGERSSSPQKSMPSRLIAYTSMERGRIISSPLSSVRMLHLIFYQPEIPPNTGNAIRLCANVGAALHLVHPLGFTLEERHLRRAGLDYHELATVVEHDSLEACLESLGGGRVFAL